MFGAVKQSALIASCYVWLLVKLVGFQLDEWSSWCNNKLEAVEVTTDRNVKLCNVLITVCDWYRREWSTLYPMVESFFSNANMTPPGQETNVKHVTNHVTTRSKVVANKLVDPLKSIHSEYEAITDPFLHSFVSLFIWFFCVCAAKSLTMCIGLSLVGTVCLLLMEHNRRSNTPVIVFNRQLSLTHQLVIFLLLAFLLSAKFNVALICGKSAIHKASVSALKSATLFVAFHYTFYSLSSVIAQNEAAA